MRTRYSIGGVRKQRGRWIGIWREGGVKKSRVVGLVKEMTKGAAREAVGKLIAESRKKEDYHLWLFGEFVEDVYLPFYRRKWKLSTRGCNENRVRLHLGRQFGDRELRSFVRDELQDFLDEKAKRYSFSMVDHLRWDLKAVFELAMAEGYVQRNPGLLLFTPNAAAKPKRKVMAVEDVQVCFEVLALREKVIAKLAILAGMRPGEIFALKCGRVSDHAEIVQRVYRGIIDTPKSVHSERKAALSEGLLRDLDEWKQKLPDTSEDALLLPSERMTPLVRENVWRRNMLPRLKRVGLEWATFQVMRRTHSSLMKGLGVDGKLVADQLGHTLDVNQNVYTQSSVVSRQEAVNRLESSVAA